MARILHIDDVSALREMIRLYLQIQGFEVTSVASGEAGIHALEESEFDGIMLDNDLPGISGERVLGWVTVHRPYLVPRLIITTCGISNPSLEARLTDFHIPVLLKPFLLEELLEQLTRMNVPSRTRTAPSGGFAEPSGCQL